MDASTLLPVLAFGTLFAVAVWGLVSQKNVEARRKDGAATKSTLAADKKSDGKPAD